jgi:flagellin-like protein
MKKAVSPVIATVLLVSMVVVLAMIVILWFTSLTGEAIVKFDNENVEVICRDKVGFDASYSGGVLSLVNSGETPIYRIQIKTEGRGEYNTEQLKSTNEGGVWPEKGLNQGKSFSASLDYSSYEKITIIPVLLGDSEKGWKTHVCDEDLTGYLIKI